VVHLPGENSSPYSFGREIWRRETNVQFPKTDCRLALDLARPRGRFEVAAWTTQGVLEAVIVEA